MTRAPAISSIRTRSEGSRTISTGENLLRVSHALYTSAHEMLTMLRAARADATYDRKLLRFTSPDLLVVDDLGLRALSHDEPLDLYENSPVGVQLCRLGGTAMRARPADLQRSRAAAPRVSRSVILLPYGI